MRKFIVFINKEEICLLYRLKVYGVDQKKNGILKKMLIIEKWIKVR